MRFFFYLSTLLLLLFMTGCSRIDEMTISTITETSWVHDNLYDDSRIVSPFDFRDDRALVLTGTKESTLIVDGDSTVTSDSIDLYIKNQSILPIDTDSVLTGHAVVSEEDFSYFALQSLILAIASDKMTPYWTTIENASEAPVFDSCREYLKEFGEHIIVISTDPLYIEFKARFLPGLTAAVNDAVAYDSLYADFYTAMEESEEFQEAYQEGDMASRVENMMRWGIFDDARGTVAELLTEEQDYLLTWFNTKLLFYGIVENNYRREMKLAPQALQYHRMHAIIRGLYSSHSYDTTFHIMAHSNSRIQWFNSTYNGALMYHTSNGFLPASLEANITDKETSFLPLIPLPLLEWAKSFAKSPLTGFSTVTISKEQGIGAYPYTISNHYNFYENGGDEMGYKMLTGDIVQEWQVNKRAKEGNISAENEYYGEIRSMVRRVNYSYVDANNRPCILREKITLTFEGWQ